MPEVAVVGDYMTDIDVFLNQTKIAPDFQCPVCEITKEERRPGGAGATVEMLKMMNVDVLSVGGGIRHHAIKKRLILNSKAILRLDNDYPKQPSLSNLDANVLIHQIEQHPEIKYIIVSDYGKGMITRYFYDSLLELGIPILVDPAKTRELEWYEGAYAIIPNMEEAGLKSIETAIGKCMELRLWYPNVLLKLGKDGMATSYQGKMNAFLTHRIDPIPINLVDVCGAGDIVIAALTAGLLQGMEWLFACDFANKMAAKKCEQFGATPVEMLENANSCS